MLYNISNCNIENIFRSKEIINFEKDVEKVIKKVRDCYYNKIKHFEISFSRKFIFKKNLDE